MKKNTPNRVRLVTQGGEEYELSPPNKTGWRKATCYKDGNTVPFPTRVIIHGDAQDNLNFGIMGIEDDIFVGMIVVFLYFGYFHRGSIFKYSHPILSIEEIKE